MHIGFRSSGGRGEYEVVGSHSGFTAASLEGWSFFMRWPDGVVRDTGLWLDPADSGKPRLRSVLPSRIQIGRIISSMLLLPDPTRDVRQLADSWPILQAKRFLLKQVGFAPDSEFAELAERVTFAPSWVEIENANGSDAIGVAARWARIAVVYERVDNLPWALRASVLAHEEYIRGADIIQQRLGAIVSELCHELSTTHGANYSDGTDPLPVLERLLQISPPTGPSLPPPNELSEDEPVISARSAHQYRLARSRGAGGQMFSQRVRAAYGHRCAFCGAKLGALDGIPSGIDAAHILAWAHHDLDVVSNGIALCKLHHWAFDAGVLMPYKDGGEYYTRFTVLADRIETSSLLRLGADGERIPDEWLPAHSVERPSATYLDRLYADLGVTLRESF